MRAAAVDYIYGMTKHSDLFKGLIKVLKGTDIEFQLEVMMPLINLQN